MLFRLPIQKLLNSECLCIFAAQFTISAMSQNNPYSYNDI